MIDLNSIKNLELRDMGHKVDGFTVVAVETITAEDSGDFASSVVETPEGEFFKLFFRYNFMFNDYDIYGHDTDGIAPSQVFPKTVSHVIYE